VPNKAPAFLTGEQVELLADEITERYRSFVLVAAFGGLRWGEVVGLRRCDVDGARLAIAGQLHLVNDRWVREEPKTAAGRRMVVLPESVGAELAAHMDRFTGDDPDALVFTNQHGNPVGKSFRHNVWLPALARAGLISVTRRSGRVPSYGKGPTFHDLRHTAVALAIQAGAHPKAIQSRLGHASIGVTMNTYGHLIDDGSELAADLDRLRSAKK
jgi:integrase